MTTVLYNQDGQWSIPGYIWPAVLGTSLAAHVSIVLFGLEDFSWQVQEPSVPPEAEIVLESGGLDFEAISGVTIAPQDVIAADNVSVVQPTEISQPVLQQPPSIISQPVESAALKPVQTPAVSVPSSSAVSIATVDPSNTIVVEAQESIAPEAATQPDAQTKPTTIEKIDPSVDVVATTVPSTVTEAVVPTSPTSTVVSLAPVTATDVVTLALVPSPVSSGANAATVNSAPVAAPTGVVTPVTANTVETEDDDVVVSTGPSVELTAPVTAVTPSQSEAIAVTSAEAPSTQAVSPQVSSAQEGAASSTVVPSSVTVATPASSVQTVRPAEQQFAAIRPSETELAAIAPTEPQQSAISASPQSSDPTPSVPPVELASIDPLAKVTNYVADYDAGECAHLSVMSAGTDTASVTAFGAGIAPFAVFDKSFAASQGYEANIELRLVTRPQCALLDAIGFSQGIEAAGLVELERTVVKSGSSVSGLIQRDLPIERIAAAETAGLELNGKGPPEIYLIDDAGSIHDGREFILPASNAATAGGWRFAIPVTLISRVNEETALLLAIWNRPKDRQPGRFSKLGANRIAEVLEAPGVYSLSAFKVLR
ncbi:hypothetical protein [uncultured Roseibium sp.]|uniref:hypothetical protein n=1 Tax=uncultured Roseibium sp. TaxID=1936171 RepID=UPI00261093E1|nr:hypothetical protein [uncultured Roseibium sp.]